LVLCLTHYEYRFRWHWQHGRHAGSDAVALSEGKLKALAAEFPGIHVANDRKLAANCDLIFLCLKAGDAASVLAQMDPEFYPGQLLT
jgi:pyrroline-5-carboxylate reductase